MKKFFITLIAFCGLALQANADVTLYVGPTTLVPGEEGQVAIFLKSDQPVTSFQTTVTLPAGLTFTGSIVATDVTETDMFGGDPLEGGTKMTVAALAVKNPYPAGEYVIGYAPVEVADGTDLADVNITVSGMVVGFEDGTDTTVDGVVTPEAGQDVVTIAEKVILDENSKSLPYDYDGDIVVKRTINANEWSTICLPFDIDADDLADAIGGDVEVAEFIEYEADGDDLKVSFDATDELSACTPYIIKTSVDVTEFEVAGAEVAVDEAVAEMSNGKTGNKKVVTGAFIGTFQAGAIPTTVALQDQKNSVDAATLFISGGKFFYTAPNTLPIKAFRGYFAFVDNVLGSSVKMYVNGLETRIDEIQKSVANDGVIYDLSGKQVRNSNLKGVFIQNGKKVVK